MSIPRRWGAIDCGGDPQHINGEKGASRRRWESTTPHPTIQEVESPMSHKILAGLGTAAGGFVAAGLISLATGPVAHADGDDGNGVGLAGAADPSFLTSVTDPGFISSTENFGLFTDIAAANPDDNEFV